jgi:hypothetical protein
MKLTQAEADQLINGETKFLTPSQFQLVESFDRAGRLSELPVDLINRYEVAKRAMAMILVSRGQK